MKTEFGMAPNYLADLVTLRPEVSRLRYSCDNLIYTVPRVRYKTFIFRCFSVQGPFLWNKLSIELKAITNIDNFKKNLKSHMLLNPS